MRLLLRGRKQLAIGGSVLTFGNLDVWASERDILAAMHEEGLEPSRAYEVTPSTSALFSRLAGPGEPFGDYVHARTFFEMAGFTSYADLDKFAQDRPMIAHDLNESLPQSLVEQFDVVMDLGTTEHIFNVPNVFASITRALKIGGHAIHSLPIGSLFWAQHGYYCFNPDVLLDFYEANGFEVIDCRVVYYPKPLLRAFDHRDYHRRAKSFVYRRGMNLLYAVPPDAVPNIWVVARKAAPMADVRTPNQGETEALASPKVLSHGALKRLIRPLFFMIDLVAAPLARWLYLRTFGLTVQKV